MCRQHEHTEGGGWLQYFSIGEAVLAVEGMITWGLAVDDASSGRRSVCFVEKPGARLAGCRPYLFGTTGGTLG